MRTSRQATRKLRTVAAAILAGTVIASGAAAGAHASDVQESNDVESSALFNGYRIINDTGQVLIFDRPYRQGRQVCDDWLDNPEDTWRCKWYGTDTLFYTSRGINKDEVPTVLVPGTTTTFGVEMNLDVQQLRYHSDATELVYKGLSGKVRLRADVVWEMNAGNRTEVRDRSDWDIDPGSPYTVEITPSQGKGTANQTVFRITRK